MKIYLKNNWSEQFVYGDTKSPGVFVGRELERKSLKNILEKNNSGTILISSVRGVGKTSFVHRVLSDLDSKITPVFVNIGHALSSSCGDKRNRIIKSIIRSIRFNKELENDNRIKEIYDKSQSIYKLEENKTNKDEETDKKSFKFEIKLNAQNIIALLGILIAGIGVSLNNPIYRTVSVILGFGVSYLSSTWEKEIKKIFSNIQNESWIKDNSTESLEIDLEGWLKETYSKDKKLVFIIDELDKINEEESLEIIKEFKNLFTRSLAQFIFIAGQETFDLMKNDRELGVKDGGAFPTFFTHVFYLSLPEAKELKDYLKEILEDKEYTLKIQKIENYLLFKSGNDFFELKRLLSDIILFDTENRPYIDTVLLKDNDSFFERKNKLFDWVYSTYLSRKWSPLKINWKNNSVLQKEVFKFLNEYYPGNFYDADIKTKNERELVDELVRIGHYEKKNNENEEVESESVYSCTNSYNRNDLEAIATEDDQKLQNVFKEMVDIANVLDDLSGAYKDESKFSFFEEILENHDGKQYSGVDLFSVYEEHKSVVSKLRTSRGRQGITNDTVKEILKIIEEQIKNIKDKYFDILQNLLNKVLPTDIIKDQDIAQNAAVFNTFGDFNNLVSAYSNKLYITPDSSKIVFLVRYFEDYEHLDNEHLLKINDRKDILILDIYESSDFSTNFIKCLKPYKDKIGRNRKKKIDIDNFIKIGISNLKDLKEVMKIVEKHLISQS